MIHSISLQGDSKSVRVSVKALFINNSTGKEKIDSDFFSATVFRKLVH